MSSIKREIWPGHGRENTEWPHGRSCNRRGTKLASRMWSSCVVGSRWSLDSLCYQQAVPNFWLIPREMAFANVCDPQHGAACVCFPLSLACSSSSERWVLAGLTSALQHASVSRWGVGLLWACRSECCSTLIPPRRMEAEWSSPISHNHCTATSRIFCLCPQDFRHNRTGDFVPFKTSSVGSYCCVRATSGACERVVGVPSESGDERRLKVKCWVSRDEFAVLGKERELGLKTEMPLSTL